MPFKHAKHNFEVCSFLKENTKYNDWIVTTAYYSTIHYVSYKLFPGKFENQINGNIQNFSSFNQFCRTLPIKVTKHRALENLVIEHLPEIYNEFKTLKDICWTARYDNYIIPDQTVKQCFDGLKAIASFCEEN